jgi:hypothetical protein
MTGDRELGERRRSCSGSYSLWPRLIGHVIAFDAERLLDDLGGSLAVVAVDLVMIYRSMFLYTHNA